MTYLEKIVAHKKIEVEKQKQLQPISELEKSTYFDLPSISLSNYLCESQGSGVIAEFKRKSPSQGIINERVNLESVTRSYIKAGAVGLSILTDQQFFGGSNNDLLEARRYNLCPILRKDFVIDEYQIVEAKSIGADVILLIAECLSAKAISKLAKTARSLGLEVLLEMHSKSQLDKVIPEVNVIGVNNRNLKTFEVNLETSFQMIEAIPKSQCCISESGITNPVEASDLKAAGYCGYLMGTHFMSKADPGLACAEFINQISVHVS